jgi:hypothetical protein
MPDLQFAVVDAEALPFAASPTLLFKLRIANTMEAEQIHSIILRVQIRLEVTRRPYDDQTQDRLLEIFGEPQRWGETLRSLLWTHATIAVPGFTGSTVAELPVPCTYDFEVVAAKYLHALQDGEAPLLFLFSGTIFYSRVGEPLQIAQIPWEKEAPFRLPVRTWKAMIDHYFPHSAWIRLRQDLFDRLYTYRTQQMLPSWEDALTQLLDNAESIPLSGSRDVK